jgi:hypothetical protein
MILSRADGPATAGLTAAEIFSLFELAPPRRAAA